MAHGARPPLAVGNPVPQQSLASVRTVLEVPLAQQSLASLRVLLSSKRAQQEPDLRAKIEQEIQERIRAEDAGKTAPKLAEEAPEFPEPLPVVEKPSKSRSIAP